MVRQYLEHSRFILSDEANYYKPNRTGIDTISRFGYRNEYNLQDGFPLLTTKKMALRSIIHELIWFLRGDSNIKYLVDNGVHIWDDNAFDYYLKREKLQEQFPRYSAGWRDKRAEFIARIGEDEEFAQRNGNLGEVYGAQWRHWKTADGKEIDQLSQLVELLHNQPQSRRMIITAWNPGEVDAMALPPCHMLYQLNVREDKLDLQMCQRSCDMFLGVPFNIASYALLSHILAQEAGLRPGLFMHSFGDAHFYCGTGERGKWYSEHLEEFRRNVRRAEKRDDFLDIITWINQQAPPEAEGTEKQDHVPLILEQLSRKPGALPQMSITPKPFEQLTIDDFILKNYEPLAAIKAAMAV